MWKYIEAKSRLEGKRVAAAILERVDFDFEMAPEGMPKHRVRSTKMVKLEYVLDLKEASKG